MKTKVRLNCYFFSNLIVGLLSLNMVFNNEPKVLVAASNKEGELEAIYAYTEDLEEEVVIPEVEEEPTEATTTVSVTKKTLASSKVIPYVKPSYNSVTGMNLVNYAKHYLGLRYVHAGNSLSTGTDCSGFTRLIFKEFGINLGRTVASQLYSGSYVSKSDLQPGDLVFYGYSNYASHVAIYIGGGMVIHESNPRDGVKISSVNMMHYITARRLITASVVKEEEKPPVVENQDGNSEVKDPEIKDNVVDENSNNKVEDSSKNENVNNPSEENKEEEVPKETPKEEVTPSIPSETPKEPTPDVKVEENTNTEEDNNINTTEDDLETSK